MAAPASAYRQKGGSFLTLAVRRDGEYLLHYVAKYLKGLPADGGYSPEDAALRSVVKVLFHLDHLLDIRERQEDGTDKVIGFVGGVDADGENVKHHNLTTRYGGMKGGREDGSVIWLNDAGLNTMGDIGEVTVEYLFANAFRLTVPATAPFYDDARLTIQVTMEYAHASDKPRVVSKSADIYARKSGAVTIADSHEEGWDVDCEKDAGIDISIASSEGTFSIGNISARIAPNVKVLHLVRCEDRYSNPMRFLQDDANLVDAGCFLDHYNLIKGNFPTVPGEVNENVYPIPSPIMGGIAPGLHPAGLKRLYHVNDLAGGTLYPPPDDAEYPRLEPGWYADRNSRSEGYYIDNGGTAQPGTVSKLWNPKWEAVLPDITIYVYAEWNGRKAKTQAKIASGYWGIRAKVRVTGRLTVFSDKGERVDMPGPPPDGAFGEFIYEFIPRSTVVELPVFMFTGNISRVEWSNLAAINIDTGENMNRYNNITFEGLKTNTETIPPLEIIDPGPIG